MKLETAASLEEGLVFCGLNNPRAIQDCGFLSAADFCNPDLGAVWGIMKNMHSLDEPVNFHTVSVKCREGGILDVVMPALLAAEQSRGDPDVHAWYADKVKISEIERRIETLARSPDQLEEVLRERRQFIDRRDDKEKHLFNSKEAQMGLVQHIENNVEMFGKGILPGAPTGLPLLDTMTGGLKRGSLTVVGARPSIGKSALLLLFVHACVLSGLRVLLCSLEMTMEECASRLMCLATGIPYASIATGNMSKQELQWMFAHTQKQAEENLLVIDTTPGMTVGQLLDRVEHTADNGGVDVLVTDYLQKMKAPGAADKRLEIDSCMEAHKNLAKDFSISSVTASQLNRDSAGKKPTLEHLKESGGIEQDSDNVFLLDRERDEEEGQLIVAKQRNGPLGIIDVKFHAPTMEWRQMSRDGF